MDTRQVNQRVLASLVKAGACDSLRATRAQMLQTLDETVEQAQRSQRARAQGQTGLFDLGTAAPTVLAADAAGQEFSPEERLTMEREMLGLYISDHPLRRWQPVLDAKVTATIAQLADLRDRQEVIVGGLVGSVKRSITRSGSAMAFLTLEDLTGSVEVLVFPRAYEQQGLALKRDTVVLLRGKLDIEEQGVKLLCDEVIPLPATPEEAVDLQVPARAPRVAPRRPRAPARPTATDPAPCPRRRPPRPCGRHSLDPPRRLRALRSGAGRPRSPAPGGVRFGCALPRARRSSSSASTSTAHPGERQVCAHVVTDEGEHVIPVQSRRA